MSLPDAPVVESATSTFDIETYIGRYAADSETRLQRLAFIAQHANDSTGVKQAALQLLETQIKKAGNVVRYSQIHPPEQHDEQWLRTATATNESSLEILEARLSQAQANLNKDAIRCAYLNLGDFHQKVGNLREALRNVMRARDYCTSRQQTCQICWNVITLSMNTANYSQVRDYVSKADHAVAASPDAHFGDKLKVAAGMALLGDGRYKDAARKFASVKIPPESMGSLASPEDVALYSSLLALATLEREELSHYLHEQPTVLELVPTIRDALRMYVRAEYKECLSLLASEKMLCYDVFLQPHAASLLQNIRNRSYVNYLQPYVKVHLPHMASMFGDDASNLQTTLADLIGNGILKDARMNCRTQTLEKCGGNDQKHLKKTQQRVGRLQESVLNDAYASMVRLACLEHEPAPERGSGFNAFANPEDVLPGVESDDDDDDVDMAMVYDAANPDDF